METSAKLYSLNYSNVKTYLFALLFIAGNIAQMCIRDRRILRHSTV